MSLQFPVTIICGPTGAGKTGVALRLAESQLIEVVSADSRQIIRHLNIGTAKPTPEERRRVPFHLVDIIEPGESYSAYRFLEDADTAISGILKRSARPVVVGGTGLYLHALSEGVIEIEKDDPSIRERLEADMEKLGVEAMYQRLVEVDPDEAARIHPNNKVRIVRALEIFELTGKPKSTLAASGAYKRSGHAFRYVCLAPPRELLYDRINRRVDQMMADGLLAEVETLAAQGLSEPIRRSNVIGYNELLDFLDRRYGLDEAVERIKQNSRRYAKRQMTWFRHQTDSVFFGTGEEMLEEIGFC